MMVNAVLSSFRLSLSDSTLSLMSARDSKLIRLSNKVQGVFARANVTWNSIIYCMGPVLSSSSLSLSVSKSSATSINMNVN